MAQDPHQNDDGDHISLHNVSNAEREEFKDAFRLFDKDGDGVITIDEIFEILQSLGFKKYTKSDVKKMISKVDIDGNGTIDLDEFISLLRSTKTRSDKDKAQTFEDELQKAFKIFDSDGSGQISPMELSDIMNKLGEKITEEDVKFMIKSIDANSDGQIDFGEFKQMMKLAPIAQETLAKLRG